MLDSIDALSEMLGEDAVGLLRDSSAEAAGRPVIIVHDRYVKSFYAWVSTYLPGVSPISQLIRVVTVSEFRDASSRKSALDARLRQAWVGVVLGECIARTKDLRTFSGMSLAAAQSAVSLAIGKMHVYGARPAEFERALERISFLQSKYSTAGNALTVGELLPVWSALSGHDLGGGRAVTKVQDLLSSACVDLSVEGRVSDDLLLAIAKIFEPARDLIRFDSVPAEARVLMFDEIVSKLIQSRGVMSEVGQIQAFVVGYAASRIAIGGLRHANLLDGVGSIEGLAKVWFCLSCFITGRASMADSMVNLARLVDRELRYGFDLADVPRYDIGWDEFSAVSMGEFSGGSLSSLPKASPRSVSIEVVPGATIVVPVGLKEQVGSVEHATPRVSLDEEFVRFQMVEFDKAIAELWKVRQSFNTKNQGAVRQPVSDVPIEAEKKVTKKKKKIPDANDLF
ncbi:hypothetical protein [Xanthomonas translucens]|nr:hypothetical protein [Xanthomonas translucens]